MTFARNLAVVWLAACLFANAHAQTAEAVGIATGGDDDQRLIELLEKLKNSIDRGQFDPTELMIDLGFEAGAIVDFVSREISFEQYPGILKGARSTLATRGGNAADQALLLATLLKDAGFDARIHRGTISRDDATALLANIRPPSEPESPFDDRETAIELMEEIDTLAKTALESSSAETPKTNPDERTPLEKFTFHNELLLSSLREQGIDLSDVPLPAGLVSEAQDYFWVEYRTGPGGDWVEAHPVLEDGQRFQPEESQIFASEIPAELQHRLGLTLKIAQNVSGTTTTRELFSWERPVANLSGTTVVVSTVPLDDGTFSNLQDGDRASGLGRLFLPKLNGVAPSGGQTFDDRGNVLPLDAAASAFAGVVRTAGNKMLGAAEALSSVEEEGTEALMSLESLLLEIDLIPPRSDEPTRIERFLIRQSDRPNIANLQGQQLEMTIGVGRPSSAELLYHSLNDTVQILNTAGDLHSITDSRRAANSFGNFFFYAGNAFNSIDAATTSYYSAPALFINHRDVLIDDKLYTGLDIASNERRSFEIGEGIAFSRVANIEAGVWESMTEAWIGQQALSSRSLSIVEAIAPGPDGGPSPSLLRLPPEPATWPERAGIGQISRALIAADLEAGFTILAPREDQVPWPNVNVWWRVRPATGETLGRAGPVGWGATLTETQALLDGIEWATCVMNVYAKCTDQVKWAFAIVHLGAWLTEQALDPSGKDWSWWDVLKSSPLFYLLKRKLEAKTGIDLDRFSDPETYIEACAARQMSKPKDEGGCEDPPPWPD